MWLLAIQKRLFLTFKVHYKSPLIHQFQILRTFWPFCLQMTRRADIRLMHSCHCWQMFQRLCIRSIKKISYFCHHSLKEMQFSNPFFSICWSSDNPLLLRTIHLQRHIDHNIERASDLSWLDWVQHYTDIHLFDRARRTKRDQLFVILNQSCLM